MGFPKGRFIQPGSIPARLLCTACGLVAEDAVCVRRTAPAAAPRTPPPGQDAEEGWEEGPVTCLRCAEDVALLQPDEGARAEVMALPAFCRSASGTQCAMGRDGSRGPREAEAP